MRDDEADDIRVPSLLAVDLGLYAGLACFDLGGAPRLRWYRSQHFGTVTKLKAALPKILDEAAPLATLCLEGDRHLGDLWAKLAEKRGAAVHRFNAEAWRTPLLLPRQRRHGKDAKAAAVDVALDAIEASGAKKPKTPLNDDVAEAICIGLYGLTLR
ncbi:MAG TPA: hypothetical protein VGF99_19725 [Myxococcota bacterium]